MFRKLRCLLWILKSPIRVNFDTKEAWQKANREYMKTMPEDWPWKRKM